MHANRRLKVEIEINGVTFKKDITKYFSKHNPHDDWLDYYLYFRHDSKPAKPNTSDLRIEY